MTTCDIEFDGNPLNVYYSGDTVSGRVTLTLRKEKTVRGIYVKIEGKAYCKWGTGTRQNPDDNHHSAEELYFSEKKYFVGGVEDEVVVSPGVYTYTFECNLPSMLPTSVEGEFGYIRYTVLVNLDRPMWPDQEFEFAFTVLKPLDLNDFDALREPLEASKRSNFNLFCWFCCCASSDDLIINGRIPVTGYTAGQAIFINIKITNRSWEDVFSFQLQIIKLIQYFAYKDNVKMSKIEEFIVESVPIEGCGRNSTVTLFSHIIIPSVPPTDVLSCDIIKVRYKLRIVGDVQTCCQRNPVLDIPITIGTVPLYVPANNTNIVENSSSYGHIPQPPPVIVSQSPPNYGSIQRLSPNVLTRQDEMTTSFDSRDSDLPTYEQAVGKIANINGSTFRPHYPVYRRNDSTSSALSNMNQ